jgi:hypothetical protein
MSSTLPLPKNIPDLILDTLNISENKIFKFIAFAKDFSSIKDDSGLLRTNLVLIRFG